MELDADRSERPIAEGTIDITVRPSRPNIATRSIVVVGAGGHGRELADIVRQVAAADDDMELLGIVDDGTPDRLALARGRFRFLGSSESIRDRAVDLYIGIGDPKTRALVDDRLGRPVSPLIHPSAVVGTGNMLGDGVVVAQSSVLTTNVRLGRHTHINVGATVSHDCVLGDYVTVCPGATLTGNVTVADRVFVGAGATVIPGVTIGEGATIGAGSTVIEDVQPGSTVVGSPARPIV